MSGTKFIVFLAIAAVLFLVFVVGWSLVPLLNDEVDMNITVLSIFFGNTIPSGWVRDLLLLSRFFFGMLLTMFFLVPCLGFFFEFRVGMYNNTIAIVMAGASIGFLILALVVHQIFYL